MQPNNDRERTSWRHDDDRGHEHPDTPYTRDSVRYDEQQRTSDRFDSDAFARSRFGYGAARTDLRTREPGASGQRTSDRNSDGDVDERPARRQPYGYRDESYGESVQRDYLGEMAPAPDATDLGPDPRGMHSQQPRPERQHQGQQWQEPSVGRGQHAGRGPRNYHRSDTRVREDVCDRLYHHSGIDASDVDVTVNDGEVTLRGSVETRQMRWLADEVAALTTGVRDVMNQLHVRRRGAGHSGAAVLDSARRASSAGHVHSQVHEHMEVVATDGEGIGTIDAVQQQGFVVSRPARTTIRVPFDAIEAVDGDRVMLSWRADQVDAQAWPVLRTGLRSS
ncbi:MAG: BON domain-containing protein [Chloroflexi bacterium]|nr:BON domain-containing protein [Chloroflexota bacterium]